MLKPYFIDFDTPPQLLWHCWNLFKRMGCDVRLSVPPSNVPLLDNEALSPPITRDSILSLPISLDGPFTLNGEIFKKGIGFLGGICFYREEIDRPMTCQLMFTSEPASQRILKYSMVATGLRRPRIHEDNPIAFPDTFYGIYRFHRDFSRCSAMQLFGDIPSHVRDETALQLLRPVTGGPKISEWTLSRRQNLAKVLAVRGVAMDLDSEVDTTWISLERIRTLFGSRHGSSDFLIRLGRRLLDLGGLQINLEEAVQPEARKEK
jgi:hypothetical protein